MRQRARSVPAPDLGVIATKSGASSGITPQPAMAADDVVLVSTSPIRQRPGDELVGVAVRRRTQRCSGGRRRPHRAQRRGWGREDDRWSVRRSWSARGRTKAPPTTGNVARWRSQVRNASARSRSCGSSRTRRWPPSRRWIGRWIGVASARLAARRRHPAPGPRADGGSAGGGRGLGWGRCAGSRCGGNPDGETAGRYRPGMIGPRVVVGGRVTWSGGRSGAIPAVPALGSAREHVLHAARAAREPRRNQLSSHWPATRCLTGSGADSPWTPWPRPRAGPLTVGALGVGPRRRRPECFP